jgi:hypothetical protein
MVDESGHNNPRDVIPEIFVRLEEKVVDISRNMALMAVLWNKFGTFGEVGSYKSKVGSNEKLEDSEDPKNESKNIMRKNSQVPISSLLLIDSF